MRSALLNVPISRKDWLGYRYQCDPHCDLADQLTFTEAAPKGLRAGLTSTFYCKAFGIDSPKSHGITGMDINQLLSERRYREIAEYCCATSRPQFCYIVFGVSGSPGIKITVWHPISITDDQDVSDIDRSCLLCSRAGSEVLLLSGEEVIITGDPVAKTPSADCIQLSTAAPWQLVLSSSVLPAVFNPSSLQVPLSFPVMRTRD